MKQPTPDNVYVLSPLQQGLLFHSLEAPDAGLYVDQTVLTLEGEVAPDLLARALSHVCSRHGALRTTFHWQNLDKPLQVVRREVEPAIEHHDWRCSPEPWAERLERFLAADRQRGFDLSTPPLFRVSLVRLDEAATLLLWTYHHILLDGWSANLLDGETMAAYAALRAGRAPDAPPVRQFGDYIAWLRRRDPGAAEAFWRARLAGVRAPTPLGVDAPALPGEPGPEEAHGERELALDPATTAALRDLARRHQLTLNTLTQGAWALLLGGYSGEPEVVFGATVAGRPAEIPGVESIVGLFINTLPVRVPVAHPADIGDLVGWLRELQGAQLAAQPHEHASLADLQRWSGAPAGRPLFESLLVFENLPADLQGPAPAASTASFLRVLGQRSVLRTQYPLVLVAVPGERLILRLTYQRQRFTGAVASRLLAHLATLLTAFPAAAAASLPPSSLSPLTPPERHQLSCEWNDTAVAYPRDRTLPELFAEVARRQPEAVAVEHDGRFLTYGELDARARGLAGRLRRLGVGREARVGLAAEPAPELVLGMLGILQAGGAYVPLDSADPAERWAQTIEAADLRVLVTDGKTPAAWPADRPRVLVGDRAPGSAEPLPPAGPDALAYVLFTSGSTGQPKAVGVPHRAVARLVLGSEYARLGPAARLGQVANPAFDAVTFEVWGALLTGGCVVGVPRRVTLLPSAFAERLRRERIGALFLTTALFNPMAREAPAAFSDLTDLLTGGEAVDPRAMAAVLGGGAPARLSHVYGPTESTTFATSWRVTEVPEGAATVPIGRPIANTRAHVLDRALLPVPAGVKGELWLSGDGLARGYLGRPRETAERFLPDPLATEPGGRLYRTGDLVRRKLSGEIEFVGRADSQVKIRGFRVEPGEVEAALLAHPAVAAAAVLAREDRPGERRLAAFVVPRDTGEEERADLAAELRQELGRKLPAYLIPAAFTLLPALPLTANGKVDRRALAGLELPAEAGERRGFVAPRTPIEELLAGAWSAVLGVERVGVDDDFLELGGHSLLATQLLSRIREAFQIELPLATLFEAPTVAGQAERVTAALLAGEASAAPPLVPAAQRTEAPLSFAQQRLWILDRLDPGLPAYNIPLAFTLKGPLRPAALRSALRTVVERHEALRTRFLATPAGPVQRVEPPADPELPQVDLTGLAAPVRSAEVERLLARLGGGRFDLARGPLLRAALVTTGEDDHAFLLSVHHIVADGWSLGILFRELAATYEAACAGRAADLPPLPVQYADYAIWQRQWLTGEVLERQLAFWRERLAGVPAGSPLAADRPRPALQTWNGALLPVAFPPALAASAHRLARAERATPFMALLAAFAELLGRTGGGTDLAIGTPVANRARRETEGLIGFFANTLVLRAKIGGMGGQPTVRQLLARLREVTLAATTHQDLPFEKLVDELKPERSLALSPFFQVLFSLENAAAPPRLADLAVDLLGVETGTAKFDLSLALTRRGEEIAGTCEYNTDLFDRTTVARLAGHLLALVDGFTAHPERPVGSVPWLSPGERQQLLVEWNDTRRAPAQETLPARFARQAARTPDAVALLSGAAATSYGELARRARRLAQRLRRLAVGPEVPVGIFLEREAALVVALLGVLAAGGAYVPLDPAYPRERLAATLEDCRAPWIVTREGLAGRLPAGLGRPLLLDEAGAPDGEEPATPAEIDPRHLAYFIYTSGSTGKPKGVAIEHRSVAAFLAWTEEVFPEADLATVFASTSICFDLSVFEIFAPLTRGGAVVLAQNALDLAALRHPRGVTLVNTVPSAAAELLRAGALPGSLRTLNLAGEPIPVALAAQLARLPVRVLNLYGPSETTTYSSHAPVGDDGRQPPAPPIGRPIAGTEILLLDAAGRPVAIGVPGEVHIAGAGLARGYFGRPERTAASFVPRPPGGAPGSRVYKTGDLARALPDGRLEFLGRRDHQVKVRGFRIEIGEVETALARHPAVAETVVVVRHDGLVAYVVPRAAGAPLAAELRADLRRTLPEFMIPQAVVELPALPRTATGKVDRAMLPGAGAGAPGGDRAVAALLAPQTALEQAIAAAVSEVMGVERVDRGDNFFDLGGSSLLLIRLAMRLEERLGRPIQPLDLFRFPSVEALARFLAAGEEEAPGAAELEQASRERHAARDRRRAMRLVSGRALDDTRGVGPA